MGLPIYLFDIAAYLHRAMYVVYGDKTAETPPDDRRFIEHACGMLANTMEKLDVKRMAVVCDSTESSLRCAIYPQYKADRKPHTPVFAAQAPRFFDALRDISVAVVHVPCYEADDLIATLNGQEPNTPYVIVSSDKDLLGCLGEWTRYFDPMKGIEVTREDVVAKFGIKPSEMYDYLGLVGDTSDGIPGVPSIGAKSAAAILHDFGTLDDLYDPQRATAFEESIGKAKRAKLLEHKGQAFLSRQLARPWLCKELVLTGDAFNAPPPSVVRSALS